MLTQPGVFYEFHRFRVVSRAGQPILTKTDAEVGPIISREDAIHQVRNGKDVYTSKKTDAEKLSVSIYGREPAYDPPKQPHQFQHFHPGGLHPQFPRGQEGRPRAEEGLWHVFFGSRGENLETHR